MTRIILTGLAGAIIVTAVSLALALLVSCADAEPQPEPLDPMTMVLVEVECDRVYVERRAELDADDQILTVTNEQLNYAVVDPLDLIGALAIECRERVEFPPPPEPSVRVRTEGTPPHVPGCTLGPALARTFPEDVLGEAHFVCQRRVEFLPEPGVDLPRFHDFTTRHLFISSKGPRS